LSDIPIINKMLETSVKHEHDENRNALALTDLQDKIYVMRYVRGMNIPEIAEALEYSNGKINKELKIIREKLRKLPAYNALF